MKESPRGDTKVVIECETLFSFLKEKQKHLTFSYDPIKRIGYVC